MNAALLSDRLKTWRPVRADGGRLGTTRMTYEEQGTLSAAYRIKVSGKGVRMQGGEVASVYDAEFIVWDYEPIREEWRVEDTGMPGCVYVVRNVVPLDRASRQKKLQCEKVNL